MNLKSVLSSSIATPKCLKVWIALYQKSQEIWHLGHTFHRSWWGMRDRLIAQVLCWLYYQAQAAYSTTWALMPSTPFRWSHSCLSDGNLGMLVPSSFPRRKTHECRQEGDIMCSNRQLSPWETWPAGSPAEHTFPVIHSTIHARSHGQVLHEL